MTNNSLVDNKDTKEIEEIKNTDSERCGQNI